MDSSIKMPINIRRIYRDKSHSVWTIGQYFFVKILVVLKFLLCARILGPDSVGMIGYILLVVGIVESLSEIGVSSALIQRRLFLNSSEFNSLSVFNCFRGLFIGMLAALSVVYFLSDSVSDPDVIVIAAFFIPFVRGFFCLNHVQYTLEHNFRLIASFECVMSAIDLIFSVVAIFANPDVSSFIYSMILYELVRATCSWLVFGRHLRWGFDFSIISRIGTFGRWMWANSVASMLLNQFDKIYVGKILGLLEFGIYQTGSRLSQLAVSDISTAYSQYLFPMFVSNVRDLAALRIAFNNAIFRIAVLCGGLTVIVCSLGPFFNHLILGDRWSALNSVIGLQALGMWFGALIAVCVAYLKAVGRPHVITLATSVQLILSIVLIVFGSKYMGMLGIVIAVDMALAVSFLILIFNIKRNENSPCDSYS